MSTYVPTYTSAGQQIAAELAQLGREIKASYGPLIKASGLAKNLKKLQNKMKEASYVVENLKAGKLSNINSNLHEGVQTGLALGSTVLNFMVIDHIGQIQEYDLRARRRIESDLNDTFQLMLKNRTLIKNLEADFKKTKERLDKNNADVTSAINNVIQVRQKANDALYEVRAGRQKLEAKIDLSYQKSNDALYEVRAGRQKLEAKIDLSYQKSNDALYEVRAGRQKIEIEIRNQSLRYQSEIQKLQLQFDRIIKAPPISLKPETDSQATKILAIANEVKTIAKQADTKIQKVEAQIPQITKTVTEAKSIATEAKSTAIKANSTATEAKSTAIEAREETRRFGVTVKRFEPTLSTLTQSVITFDKRLSTLTESTLKGQFSSSDDVIVITRDYAKTKNKLKLSSTLPDAKGALEELADSSSTTSAELAQVKQDVKKLKELDKAIVNDITRTNDRITNLQK